MRPDRPVALLATASALTALALTACDSETQTGTPTGTPTTTTGKPVISPSSSRPRATAADGDDIRACADAACEITVSEPVTIPFDGPEGRTELSVTEVGRNKLHYKVTSADGHSSGSAEGAGWGCFAVLGVDSSSSGCGPAAPAPSAPSGTVVIQLTTGEDGVAVIRIRSH
jgi:hypothetical protein